MDDTFYKFLLLLSLPFTIYHLFSPPSYDVTCFFFSTKSEQRWWQEQWQYELQKLKMKEITKKKTQKHEKIMKAELPYFWSESTVISIIELTLNLSLISKFFQISKWNFLEKIFWLFFSIFFFLQIFSRNFLEKMYFSFFKF